MIRAERVDLSGVPSLSSVQSRGYTLAESGSLQHCCFRCQAGGYYFRPTVKDIVEAERPVLCVSDWHLLVFFYGHFHVRMGTSILSHVLRPTHARMLDVQEASHSLLYMIPNPKGKDNDRCDIGRNSPAHAC